MKVLSGLLAFIATVDALNLRCQYYRWDSTEVKYVCKGDENAVTWSADEASTTPNLMYLGEFRTNLGVCQGRCRSDSDCQDGLICIFRDPTVPVIDDHCANGHVHRFVNYCYYNDDEVQEDFVEQAQNDMPVDQLVYRGEPPFTSKLRECQGDCDTDWNCDFGLNCYKRSDDRQIPGCEGVGIYSVDYCYAPPANTLVLVMDAEASISPSQAGKCEGSCVDDNDCLMGLECFQRANYEYVPGCRGLGAHATNYCFDPNDIVVPTAMPQGSPTATPTTTPTNISQRVVIATDIPIEIPSEVPTMLVSGAPSSPPSGLPTAVASSVPSSSLSSAPSGVPSSRPSALRSQSPSDSPSSVPTVAASSSPSDDPSSAPTTAASGSPSDVPSSSPTVALSNSPSDQPSMTPVADPSSLPSDMPSSVPSITPSQTPSNLSSAPTVLTDNTIPTAGILGNSKTKSPTGATGKSPTGATGRPTSMSQNVVDDREPPSNSLVPPLEVQPSNSKTPSVDTTSTKSDWPSLSPTTVELPTVPTAATPKSKTKSPTGSSTPPSTLERSPSPSKTPSMDTSVSVSDWPSMSPTTDDMATIPKSEKTRSPTGNSLSETGRPTSASQTVVGGTAPPSPTLLPPGDPSPSSNKTPSDGTSISTSDSPSMSPSMVEMTKGSPVADNSVSKSDSPSLSPVAVASDWPALAAPSVVNSAPTSPVAGVTSTPTMLSGSVVGGDRDGPGGSAPTSSPSLVDLTNRFTGIPTTRTSVPTTTSESVVGGPLAGFTSAPTMESGSAVSGDRDGPGGSAPTLSPSLIEPTNKFTRIPTSRTLLPTTTSESVVGGPVAAFTSAPTIELGSVVGGDRDGPGGSAPTSSPSLIEPTNRFTRNPTSQTLLPTTTSESVVGGDRDQSSETLSPMAAPTTPIGNEGSAPTTSPMASVASPNAASNPNDPTAQSCIEDPELRARDILLELANNGFDMDLEESTMAFYWLISEEAACPDTRNIVQRFTMATLYYSLSGWNCTETNPVCFLSNANECLWDGVNCNSFGEVTNLRLDDLNLIGSLPNLSGLSSLVELDMDSNMLSGNIPTWIGNLGALEILDLDSNKITGSIPPELGDASLLRVIDLDGNNLTGFIPEELGLLENLYFLQLDFNQLTGSVPSSIVGVLSLEYLSVIGNNFTEPLSIDFCDRQLELYANCEMCSIAECCTACLTLE